MFLILELEQSDSVLGPRIMAYGEKSISVLATILIMFIGLPIFRYEQ